jgi:hypothetical protein
MLMGKLSRALDLYRGVGEFIRRSEVEPSMEVIYRDLFVRDLERLGLPDIYYPVGAAANHGLLYAVLRTVSECQVSDVLELGAGQTTLLLDNIRRSKDRPFEVRTIEHDARWAEQVGQICDHEVRIVPLIESEIDGRTIRCYDAERVASQAERFDLMVVDGPIGPPFNRLGALGAC